MPLLQLLSALLATARSNLKSQHVLALENLALRQQLAILRRRTKRPQLTKTDRAFWVALSRLWTGWQGTLIVVKPQTRHLVASQGLQALLDMEEPQQGGGGRASTSRSDASYGRWLTITRPGVRLASTASC